MTIGGALAANIHGRGLRLRPIIADVDSFDLVDRTGALVRCSRTMHRELFALAIGGYGLFGVIARVTLRLTRRHKVERRVSIVDINDLPELFDATNRRWFRIWRFSIRHGAPNPRSFCDRACSRAIGPPAIAARCPPTSEP